MLDVHPPHERIHGVRDFLLHLLTITVGLLIALGLEAIAEAGHHRHQRIEAEATIRREIDENRHKLQHMQEQTTTEIADLRRALVFIEDLRSGQKDDPKGITLIFNSEPLHNAGWSTASATGALTYMEYEEVERFATAYHEQEMYDAAVARALEHYEVLGTYVSAKEDPRNMNPRDIEAAIPDLRRALADLGAMHDAGRGALATYDDALK